MFFIEINDIYPSVKWTHREVTNPDRNYSTGMDTNDCCVDEIWVIRTQLETCIGVL